MIRLPSVDHPAVQWIGALLITLVINLALFWVLPQLTGQVAQKAPDTALSAVHMVKVSPDPPPRQMTPRPPEEKPQLRPKVKQPQTATLAAPTTKLHLEVAPQLTSSFGDVALPQVQLAQIAAVPSVFDSEALDRPLTPLAQSPFIYPLRAKRLGIEGWVKVKLLVGTDGQVEQVEILDAEPRDMFEDTVERGIRRWRFTPGTVQGEAVRSWVITTIRFELES